VPGATYFFTVALAERRGNDRLVRDIGALRDAFRQTRDAHPFRIDAIVVLPDHLHCLWTLPAGDDDFPLRWRLIKARFSRSLMANERISPSRARKGERGIWQRRYWEHLIRDKDDFRRHADYIHYNPVRHNYVETARDWPYSSFRLWVRKGLYPVDWAASPRVIEGKLE
jgi:putative transposase